jgi:hypothetical protein
METLTFQINKEREIADSNLFSENNMSFQDFKTIIYLNNY